VHTQLQQDKKLKEQITKLRRENQVLRRADAEIRQTIRQRDQNASLEVTKMVNSTRQSDVHSELKKIIRKEINQFLIEEKLCVSGHHSDQAGGEIHDYTVEFGFTFPRKPTVSASLTYVNNKSGGRGGASVGVGSVSTSSASFHFDTRWRGNGIEANFGWIACL